MLALVVAFIFFLVLIVGGESSNHTQASEETEFPQAVLKWKEKVSKEAEKTELLKVSRICLL